MRSFAYTCSLAAVAFAAEPWINEVDTGLTQYLSSTNYTEGNLPLLKDMRAVMDFDYAARQFLDDQKYSFYRTAAGGEWSYRNNLDVWKKIMLRPRHLHDVSKLNETLPVKFLGYNFSAPIFIAPAARGGYANPERAELNFVDAAAKENILYTAALYASKTIEELAAQKHSDTMNGPQVMFQQIYTNANFSVTWDAMKRAEGTGAKAFVWTIDAPGDSTRHRAARYDTTNANGATSALTWDLYDEIKSRTSLPVIPKGIVTVEDALMAVEKGAPAIYLSNHGGRQLEYSPSPLEIAYEIHRNAPQVFQQVEVMADSGVRYGTDVLKLLTLGVKMGVEKLIQILKTEIVHDGAQAGVTDLKKVPRSLINARPLEANVFLMDQ
ncbi:putative CYB2-lactate dehydrogenase cytochrome b2 [Apiospora phragmitis]|uniref:CYB2-lactate dehydrogenase cytochrome b2 n=1 Tax=Apiospora phragmitis TaxID=2905665 RepID=A0ABR1TPI8_9PEZI